MVNKRDDCLGQTVGSQTILTSPSGFVNEYQKSKTRTVFHLQKYLFRWCNISKHKRVLLTKSLRENCRICCNSSELIITKSTHMTHVSKFANTIYRMLTIYRQWLLRNEGCATRWQLDARSVRISCFNEITVIENILHNLLRTASISRSHCNLQNSNSSMHRLLQRNQQHHTIWAAMA